MDFPLSIVPAEAKDAASMQEVFYQTWLATYPNEGAGVTVADIEARWADRLSPERLGHRIDQIEHPPPGLITLVARQPGGRLLGICIAMKGGEENEVHSLYVLPGRQRSGVGSVLLAAADIVLNPTKPTTLHVADYNAGAIRFYEKRGYVDTGDRYQDPRFVFASGARICAIVMRRRAWLGP